MLIDKDDKDRRLSSPRNLMNVLPLQDKSVIVQSHNGGRKLGIPNTPQSLRIIAGVLAKTESNAEVASALGVSATVVANSCDAVASTPVGSAVERTTARIRDMALERLMLSLGIIDETSLSNVGAKDASTVARNLATVVDKLSPREASEARVQLILHAPRQRGEEQYETIDVKVIG